MYYAFAAAVFLLEILVMVLIGTSWGIMLVMIGIWPAFLYSLGAAILSVVRIPWNMFYHMKVTYRTVCLRTNLKVINILLIPFVHVGIPIVVTFCATVLSFTACFFVSFFGYPCKPWKNIRPLFETFWEYYVTNIEEFVANYGHESGVPENWDGKVYGLPIDPITLIVGIFLLVYGVVIVTCMQGALFLVKALPMYIWILQRFAETNGVCMALAEYGKLVKSYAQADVCKMYCDFINGYYECRPTRMMPQDCFACVLLSWVIILGSFTWCLLWPLVLISPLASYVLLWVVIIVGPPIGYIISWLVAIAGPWACLIVAISSGPLVALRVPYVSLRHNLLLPGQFTRSVKFGLNEPFDIFTSTDRLTSEICLGNWRLFPGDSAQDGLSEWRRDVESRRHVRYWDLFIARCQDQARESVRNNWLTKDDVEANSSNVMVAIPGLAILDILVNSIKREGDSSLIYWDEENQCDDSTRDRTDNISNHYWPLLMNAKDRLRTFLSDGSEIEQEGLYIAAKLCAGEDEQSEELAQAMNKYRFEDAKVIELNRSCADIVGIVLSLLRTQEMKARFRSVGTSV